MGSSARKNAFRDVLAYLDYRVTVCRDSVREYEASHGCVSRAAATERSAMFEAELIQREIEDLSKLASGSRELKALVAERQGYLAGRSALSTTTKGEGDE